MKTLHVRNVDINVHEKLKHYAEQKNISMNELVKTILERAVITRQMESQNQLIINEMESQNRTINKLIEAIEFQTKEINELNRELRKILG